MRAGIATAAVCLFVSLWGAAVKADPVDYTKPTPVKKLALVVAFSDYEKQAKLPGTLADADKMTEILTAAGFDVTPAKDVKTRNQFIQMHLVPFVEKIGAGDFVVIYFSGHGLNYGGQTFLVPLDFPPEEKVSSVVQSTLPLTNIQDLVAEKNPGFVLVLLDACRSVPQFDLKDPNNAKTVAKGLAMSELPPTNIVVGFATDPGKTAAGSSEPGKTSVYTTALGKVLQQDGLDFDKAEKEITFEVMQATQNEQKPWFSENSTAIVYFKPNERTQGEERESWLAALNASDPVPAVQRFLAFFSVSPFAANARKWLEDNKNKQVASLTRVSPYAPEIAWNVAKEESLTRGIGGDDESEDQPIKLRSITGPFAFSRTVRGDAPDLNLNDVLETGDTRGLGGLSRGLSEEGEVFVHHSELVVTGPVDGRESPDSKSRSLIQLTKGTKVTVSDVKFDAKSRSWAEARVPGRARPVYIELPTTSTAGETDIGMPLYEVLVPGLQDGLKTLVDSKPLLDAVAKLKREGKQISWVSIATPSTTDAPAAQMLQDVFAARAAHVSLLLTQAGVNRLNISTVEELPDVASDKVRVRFFGGGGGR